MKSLIITAHPSSLGFTHKIAEAYKDGVISMGGQVEILDLYKENPRQEYLSFENIKDVKEDVLRDSYQKKIIEATDIVFIHPLWWGATPAIMKNFIDCNFTARFAYRYINGRPVGLLKGRTGSVYITCDGSIWIYRFLLLPFKIIWGVIFFTVCGIKVNHIRVVDKKFSRNETFLEKFLIRVKKDTKKLKY